MVINKLFGLMFVMILMVGMVSALEFDNVKDYDVATKTVTITNAFGLGDTIATVKLESELDVSVIRGEDRRVAEFTINNFDDSYDNALKEMEFYNLKRGSVKFDREFEYKYRVTTGNRNVSEQRTICPKGFIEVDECHNEIVSTETFETYDWLNFNEKTPLIKGEITIGIFTEVYANEKIEWIPTFFGERIEEWAVWTEGLNDNLVAYYTMNETSGTTALNSIDSENNLTTNAGTITWVAGQIANAGGFDGNDCGQITGPLGVSNGSINLWVQSAIGGNYFFGTNEGGSGTPNLDFTLDFGVTQNIGFYIGSSSIFSTTAPQTANFQMITAIWGEQGMEVFVNGTSVGTNAVTDYPGNETLGVGCHLRAGSPQNYGTGPVDEIAIWSGKILTPTEITQLYNGGAGMTYISSFNVAPTTSLNIPANATTYTGYPETVTFNCSATDDTSLKNLSLFVNGVINETVFNLTDTDLTLSLQKDIDFYDGYYNWTCDAYDSLDTQGVNETWVFNVSADIPTVNLITPTNAFNSSVDITDFYYNFTVQNDSWDNFTLNVWNSSNNVEIDKLVINGTSDADCSVTTDGQDIEVDCVGLTISEDEDYHWNVYACKDTSLCAWATSNSTFTIDQTDPTFDSIGNLTNLTTFSLPINSTWNMTITDPHLDSCWYNTTENATLTIETCNTNFITEWATSGTKIIYYYANDTFGNEINGSDQMTIFYITSNYKNTPDIVGEGGTVKFELEVNLTDTPTTIAYLYLNNTLYDPDTTSTSTDSTIFNISVAIPDGWGNTSGNNIDYYWNYSVGTLTYNRSTATDNITVFSVGLDDCSTYGLIVLNFSLFDEEDNDFVNATAGATIEVDVDLTAGGTVWSYSNTWLNNQSLSEDLDALVCISPEVLNNTKYTMDYTVGFSSTDHVHEFFYLDNGTLEFENSLLNSLTNRTKTLFDLLTADSTSFLFNYYDNDGMPVEDSIVHVFRKYIGDGEFREVERAKQDESGDTTIHLLEEDAIYYFIVSLDSQILYTSSTYTALCQAVPCTIQLTEGGEFQGFDEDDTWDGINDGSILITQSDLSREVNLSFILATPTTMNLTIYEYTSDGEYSGVASDVDIGSTGVISLTVPTSVGNKTFFASVYQDDIFVRSYWVDMEEDAGMYFGNTLSLFLAFLVILTLGLMAVSEGGAVIIWILLGMLFTSIMGLVDYNSSTGVGLLIYFIVAGAILIWKLSKKNR